ncbi:hypothetical protein B0H12DRAFT_1227282 [Mycena haematopus]|nr:hypothetical protein B0H12DRAFT_1227282 [Mycena haematopus]
MPGPNSPSQTADREALHNWLAEANRGQLIASILVAEPRPSLNSLKISLEAFKRFPHLAFEFPGWLAASMSTEPNIASSFEDLYQEHRDELDVVETLIWKIWHDGHANRSRQSSGFTSNEKARLLHNGFTADYRGDAPTRFCQILRDGYRPWYWQTRHYGRIIAIIQSSATGKTRLFYEIGEKYIPAFCLCFRKFSQDTSIDPKGWPYGDYPVVDFFQPSPIYTSEEIAAAFIGQLYKALALSAQGTGINCFAHLAPSPELAHRDSFLRNVCVEAKDALAHRVLRDPHMFSDWSYYRQLFDHYVKEHANALATKLHNRTKYAGADFLLVIDECTLLDKLGGRKIVEGKTKRASFLTGIRRIFKAGDLDRPSAGFWLILLDTHGKEYTLYPADQERASSARLAEVTYVPLPPWIDLGFDVNMPASPPGTPEKALAFEWLKKCGRPYWDRLPPSDILSEATAKLFCGSPKSEELDHVITAMSRRIHLPLSNDLSNTATHLVGVEKYMRYMTSIGWEAGTVTTAALSEPVLSIAAAHTLLESPAIYCKFMERFIADVLTKGHLLERGRLGEILASIVLIIARDAATCTFRDAEDYQSTFAWINFMHFDILPSILYGVIPAKLLLDAWCRSVAFQCADNQPLYDLLIPIYLGDLDQPFQLAKLSYVVVQVKARVAAVGGKGVLETLTGPMIDIGAGQPHKPSYLAILMDLGAFVALKLNGSKSMVHSEHVAASQPQKKTDAAVLSHYSSPESPRWAFHARGIHSDTYPSLEKFGAEKLHRALYERFRDEDDGEGREAARSAAMDWVDTTANILTKG